MPTDRLAHSVVAPPLLLRYMTVVPEQTCTPAPYRTPKLNLSLITQDLTVGFLYRHVRFPPE